MSARVHEAGRNAWCIADATRAAVLIDGAAYFSAFAAAAARAQRSLLVLGWDVDSRIALHHEEPDLPQTLGAFLDALVHRRPKLTVHILSWDYPILFAAERELLTRVRLGWATPERVHFHLDDNHPLGGAHHQKIVVVDDRVAFLGGLDLTARRWDTPAHRPEHPDRRDPEGAPYDPFHDVQIAVEGAAAARLGDLVRERWRRATGERLAPSGPVPGDPWPPGLVPDVRDVPVAISRTDPAFDGRAPVAEIEASYVDSIAAARRWLYVENQYLTSRTVEDALTRRLAEPEGPEIVLVVPLHCSGWLEEQTMGVLRAGLVRRLRRADRHERLRVYHPDRSDLGDDACINLHAKVLVADDQILRVGSSNLSNRSMGLDSECDLVLEAAARPDTARAIARVRDRLVAEHVGGTAAEVAAILAASGSLIQTIDRLGSPERRLALLPDDAPAERFELAPAASALADLERPVVDGAFAARMLPVQDREPASRSLLRLGAVVAFLLGLAAMWAWTPLGEWLTVARLAAAAERVRTMPGAPLVVIVAYIVGSAVMLPLTILIVATILVFGPWTGIAYALAGSLCAAAIVYGAGRTLWRDLVDRLAGRHLDRLVRRLSRRGVLAIAIVRLLPVAPFTVVNLVAGALRLRFAPFMVGSLLGLVPGVVLIALLGIAIR
jgi:phospholipase D1/2